MIEHIEANLKQARQALDNLIENPQSLAKIASAGQTLADCFQSRGHVYSCGNGGSLCDAMHFAEELSGRFRQDRPALGAIAIADPSHLSCTANDFGYDHVFARFIEAQGRQGDVLLAISTSGTSKNVIKAAEKAKQLKMKVIALTGKADCPLGHLADIHIATPGGRFADRVQELHIKVIHILIELVERSLFQTEYEG